MHHYTAFGLNITSAIPFPELLEGSFNNPDVTIITGKVPQQLQGEVSQSNEASAANHDEFLWDIPDVCKYYASNGKNIIIEPYDGIDNRSVRLYLLATVMASILYQRNTITLHASAININGKLTLITGDSGAGKSTALAGLVKKKYRIFSDDIIVIKEDKDKRINALASYPMIKLWDDAIVKLQDELFNDRSFHVAPDMDKYGIFFHKDFDRNPYPVERAFILHVKEDGAIETRRLEDADAFKGIEPQVYRPHLLHSNYLRQLNFTTILNLIRGMEIIEIVRPKECDPDELIATIEAFL
jgi:hypothetical protein